MHNCKEVTFDGGVIEFVNKAKYLGVMLIVGRNLGVYSHAVRKIKFISYY